MTIIATVALSLSSCDYIKEVTGQKEVPLPGQRISVMLNEGELQADPRVSDLRVLLPTPRENPNWTQAGGNATHAMHHLKIRNTV
ncbi:MAG: pyrrolo-quinoline quinone, partial [Pseudomonadota bacterium]|nr:pyrrolo-quinoline quinone [Pseudomonadota bacterium]